MANEFSVTPLGGLDVGAKLTSVLEGGKQNYRLQQWHKTAPDIIKAGDPDAIANLMIEYPEMAETMVKAAGYKQQRSIMDLVNTAKGILIGEVEPSQALGEHIQKAQSAGEDVSRPLTTLGKTLEDPAHAQQWAQKILALYAPEEYQQLRSSMGVGETPTDIDDFVADADAESIRTTGEPLTPGRRNEMRMYFKRAQAGEVAANRFAERSVDIDTAGGIAQNTATGTLTARRELEPEVEGAVVTAKKRAESVASYQVDNRAKKAGWDVYNGAMQDLYNSMADASTGPFVGLIPAITTNAQIADGAVANMAPILKQMFRAAGEGVFTDKDQELLMKMIPSRRNTPEARLAKIRQIDNLVRSKLLGVSGEPTVMRVGTEDGVYPAPLTTTPKNTSDMSDDELFEAAFGGN